VGASTIFFLNDTNVVIENLKSQDVTNFKLTFSTVQTNSADWGSVYSNVNLTSANNLEVNTVFGAQSANNLSVYTTVNTNSAVSWLTLGKVLAASVSISI